jgi:oligopeptide/dipeptide ABC transporter ATP-binding protein
MRRTTGSGPGSGPGADPGPLLAVDGLRVASAAGEVLRGVDLRLARGEVLGVVGESGSGKSTLGLAILGLLGRSRQVVDGEVRFEGRLIGGPGVDGTGTLRGRRIGYVPQDPFRAFDPLRRVGPQARRPLERHLGLGRDEADARILALLGRLGVPEPERAARAWPHELSGGMLQRAAIAAALSCDPDLVVADEPTTALDALVQAQVIEAFLGLVRDAGTAVLVITHDLRLLRRTADRVAAMYAGRIVEFGPAARLLEAPRHPYPAALLAASVLATEPGRRVPTIDGQPPALPGRFAPCAFAPRCPRADGTCWQVEPAYPWPAAEGEACHHPIEAGASVGAPLATGRAPA